MRALPILVPAKYTAAQRTVVNRLVKQLVKDHQQIEALLDELEREIANYESDSGRDPDLPLILAGLEYVRSFPQIYHHPLEDLLMAQIQTKNIGDDLRQCITNLLSQHIVLEQQTELLEQDFFSMANGMRLNKSSLFSRFRNYCMLQREHLQVENEVLLPAIEHWLKRKDYSLVREKITISDDDSHNSRKRFERLQKTVVNHSWRSPTTL
jgi:hemerythrin-like domain-containing protein